MKINHKDSDNYKLHVWCMGKNYKVFCQKGEKYDEIAKITFQQSQKLLAENLHERPLIQNIQ